MSSVNISRILLLTGVPGVGKTTLIQKVATALRQHQIGGFYTEEMRVAGRRTGFRMITFNHDQGVFAHEDLDGREHVGKYGVDVTAIDRLVVSDLICDEAIEVYLIDEIGNMECLSDVIVERTLALPTSRKPLIAKVAKQGSDLIQMVKQWPGKELWEITRANRATLIDDILQWIERRL